MSADTPETKRITTNKVSCDGDEGALGHPRVYLTVNRDGMTECPYCDRRYLLIGSQADKANT